MYKLFLFNFCYCTIFNKSFWIKDREKEEIIRWHKICDRLFIMEDEFFDILRKLATTIKDIKYSNVYISLKSRESIYIQMFLKATELFLAQLQSYGRRYFACRLPIDILRDILTIENIYLPDICREIKRFRATIGFLDTDLKRECFLL